MSFKISLAEALLSSLVEAKEASFLLLFFKK